MDRILENYFNLAVMAQALPTVFDGFLVTVQVALSVIAIGIGAGLALALLRCAENPVLNGVISLYVEVFRTLPQLVILIFIFFGLPYMGIRFSPFLAVAVGLGAVLSAFAAETFWAAINALPKGQWEASAALGMSRMKCLFYIILPQAIRLATPLITNRAIAITKGTALGVAVSLQETLGSAQSVMAILANPSPLTLAAGFYLLFFIPLVIASRIIENRMAKTTG
ncbi:amino acid ABC transporter permease [Stappia stellulata]|uniref:amino acid ABC transporter permease n=1 Tax=Stappia stellulata TaxID=71235 RepID=UPI00048F026F|nr:amino acid ABC transporter permease [Stappia stellulata]